jgi:3'(2'), 5'-bisphosphate nucleotidase
MEAHEDRVACGPDDPSRPALDVVRSLPTHESVPRNSRKIYLIGFQHREADAARRVTEAGLEGVAPDDMPGCIYELVARGEFAGSLIHSPNVYDFPVSLHLARLLGGDAVWADSGEPVHFRDLWRDERANMLRLPGIVACSPDRSIMETLRKLAAGWCRDRYHDGPDL